MFDRRSWNPIDIRILVYIWDNNNPIGTILPNTWVPKKERMIVLQSGTEKVGEWITERRNSYLDFKEAFPGEEPGKVKAFAIVADTDQTGEQVTTYFDDFSIQVK